MMGSDISPMIDEMVRQFTAWKFLSKVEKDPTKLRTLIARSVEAKSILSTAIVVPPAIPPPTKVTFPSIPRTIACYRCGEEGHISRNCPGVPKEVPPVIPKTPEVEEKASSKRSKVSDEGEVLTSYMVKTRL